MRFQHRLSPLVLAIGLLVGQPRSLRAAEPEPEPEPVIDIEVDAADLPATRAELANTVSTEVNRALAEQDSLPAGVFVAADRRVLVELHPSPIPGSDEVLIHVEVLLDGERLAESTTETCLSCSDAGVADKVLLLLTPLLPKLPAPPAPPAPAIAEHEAQTLDTPPAPPRRELLIPGAVLLGTGVVGLGVGIGLFVLDERLVSPPNALEFDVIKYRQPGIATMVIGSAATVTGAVLLTLALHQRRRAHVAAAPIAGPHAVGVLFSGRF